MTVATLRNGFKSPVIGFVGYKLDGEIKGYVNHFKSGYNHLGLKVLRKFEAHPNDMIKHIFLKNVHFGKSAAHYLADMILTDSPDLFTVDWNSLVESSEKITVLDDPKFLESGTCKFGYVFNVDEDTLDIYRGPFFYPQDESEQAAVELRSLFGEENDKQYTHLVWSIKRDEIHLAKEYFSHPVEPTDTTAKDAHLYPEQAFLRERNSISI